MNIVKGSTPHSLSPLNERLDVLFGTYGHWEIPQLFSTGKEFRVPAWDFARACLADPELRELSHRQKLREVQDWMHSRGRTWEDFGFKDNDDGDVRFLRMLETARYAMGEDPLQCALAKAVDGPISTFDVHYINEAFEFFLSVLFHLQRATKDNVFVSCRKFGEALGKSPQTISDYCHLAVGLGFLIPTKPHEFGKGKKPRAAEFRFVCEKFDPDTLEEREAPIELRKYDNANVLGNDELAAEPGLALSDSVSPVDSDRKRHLARSQKLDELTAKLDDNGWYLPEFRPEALEPQKTPNNALMPLVREVFEYYTQQTQRDPRLYLLSDSRLWVGTKSLRFALRMSSHHVNGAVGLMKRAIDKLVESDWHMGRSRKTRGRQFNDWDANLFGNREAFRKLLR